MNEPTGSTAGGDASQLASSLEPTLRSVCGDRLSRVQWFRADWQRGGAATGYATYTLEDGSAAEAVVKLPVGPTEYRWTTALGSADAASEGADNPPTPRVYASGTELGGYDLAWLVIERLDGPPLSREMSRAGLDGMLASLVEWYARTQGVAPVAGRAEEPDWQALLSRARQSARDAGIPEAQRWNEQIRAVQRALPRILHRWTNRPITVWCHGDPHPANALRRSANEQDGEGKRWVLIDLALVHPGHWVEDAVYLERLYWGRKEALDGIKPVSALGRLMRKRGLAGGEDHNELAAARRVLTAACSPAFLHREGDPRHLHAALEVIETQLPAAAR